VQIVLSLFKSKVVTESVVATNASAPAAAAAAAAAPSKEGAVPDAEAAAATVETSPVAAAAEGSPPSIDMTSQEDEIDEETAEAKYNKGEGPSQSHLPSRMASQVSVLSSVPSIGSMAPLPVSSSLWQSDAASVLHFVDHLDSAPMEEDDEHEEEEDKIALVRCFCTFVGICELVLSAHLYGSPN